MLEKFSYDWCPSNKLVPSEAQHLLNIQLIFCTYMNSMHDMMINTSGVSLSRQSSWACAHMIECGHTYTSQRKIDSTSPSYFIQKLTTNQPLKLYGLWVSGEWESKQVIVKYSYSSHHSISAQTSPELCR